MTAIEHPLAASGGTQWPPTGKNTAPAHHRLAKCREAIALHHLDAPWRPADIEQRDGRILRQGNQNASVEILRYVTEESFDTFLWQTLERKSAFIHQVSGGDIDQREIDDIGEQVLSFAEVKALATGDPRIMEKAGVDADVARLTRLERSWHDDQRRLRRLVDDARYKAHAATERAERLTDITARVTDTRGDRFTMTIDGRHHAKRKHAGEHLRALLAQLVASTPAGVAGKPRPIAQLGALDIHAQAIRVFDDNLHILIPAIDDELRLRRQDWETPDPIGLIQRVEHRLQRLPDDITDLRCRASANSDEATRAEARLGTPWEHAAQLARLRRRQQELDDALTQTDTPTPDTATSDPASVAVNDLERLRPRLDRPHTPTPSGGISL